MPLREALPILTLLDMVPRVSTKPEACAEAEPKAQTNCCVLKPSNLPVAIAAPNTPQVEVMCQPRE